MPKFTPEQQEAINKEGTNIIVSAGAGSGKTAVLTKRVIRKLKDGVDIDKLLILTFTNAAAKEMKDRIKSSIIKNNLINQLDLIDSAYITTFDSYALSLVKKYHYLLNVSKKIKIIDKSVIDIKKEEIIDEIFDEYYLTNNSDFQKLVNDYCFKDDKELKQNIIKLSNILDLKIDKEKFLNNYVNKYYQDTNWIVADYIKLLKEKITNIQDNLECLKCNNDLYYKLLDSLSSLFHSETYDEIKINCHINLPRMNKLSDEEKEYKNNINKLISELKELTIDNLDTINHELVLTKDNVQMILIIIQKLDEKINNFKNKYDTYEFNDIAKMAIKVVKENEEVKEELKHYYNEIMVDEYQDTSDIQETFIKLIENNNVYMVGDIKQSIYRFRNANPLIFKQKYLDYSNNINGYKIDLTKNFRSRKEVLADINKIFNEVMDLEVGGADYKATHQMVFGNINYIDNNSYLDLLNYELNDKYTKEEMEIFTVVNDIKDKMNNHYQVMDKNTNEMRDIKYSDFCIIMDRNSAFDQYKKIFEYENIPLVMYKDEVLNNGIDIILIKNILNLILKIKERKHDQEFRYYFTSIARSYLIEMTDQEIYDIFTNKSFKDSKLYEKCLNISNQLDLLDSPSLIELVTSEFDIINKTIKIGNINETIIRIDYLKDLAVNLVDVGYDVYDFIKYLNNLDKVELKYSINTDALDNVKIMNIHKSKGLEFPVCYYTGMHKKFNIADLKDLILYDNYYGIVIPNKDGYIKDTILKTLVKDRYLKEEISEKIRLFYVALTRAREKMIIVASLSENDNTLNKFIKLNYKSFLDILNSIYNQLKITNVDPQVDLNYQNILKDNKLDNIKETDQKIEYINLNLNNEAITSSHISKVANKVIDSYEQEKLDLGTYMHYLFEVVDFKSPNMELIDKKYQQYLNNFLNQDLLKDLDCNIYKEYEFMYIKDGIQKHGFIDLFLEYDNYINLIDYKLKNTLDDAYTNQLQEYQTYLEMKTNKKVNLYLYSIVDNEFRQII